jgi:alpha-L-arabinofuranosidase
MRSRRTFLRTAAGAALAARSSRASSAEVTVLLGEPIGAISPMLHGHFVEHLGGVVYDGIWVGEDSKIPSTGGIRKSLTDALRKIKAPVIRWPGGCFADSYDWRDGVGPRASRPKHANFWIGSFKDPQKVDQRALYESNAFGTNEFNHFCRLAGSEPYLAVNLRGGSPKDFDEWVEYCNSPASATTPGARRASSGDAEPFNVRYWGIGNESWGCGGEFTGEEYSVEFRRFISWVPGFGVPLKFIAAGPNGGDLDWSRGFFSATTRKDRGALNRVWGFALHYYCGTTGNGQALEFTESDWYELLARASRMESLVTDHWTVMGQYDAEHKVKLVVDEWGAWHRSGSEVAPHHLFGQNSTMRDAVIAALTLDTFHRHADKIAMANVAQLINCLHSLFLAYEDQFLLTPNYHVFDMYQAHQGNQAVRAQFGAPVRTWSQGNQKFTLPILAGSASTKDKRVVLTLSNAHATEALELNVAIPGARPEAATGQILAGDSLQAHNSFAKPDAVKPAPLAASAGAGGVRVQLPAASVARLLIDLA